MLHRDIQPTSSYKAINQMIPFLVNVVSAEGFNMDKEVAEFVEKWLPLNHKPNLAYNKVFIMADLYNIIDLVSFILSSNQVLCSLNIQAQMTRKQFFCKIRLKSKCSEDLFIF